MFESEGEMEKVVGQLGELLGGLSLEELVRGRRVVQEMMGRGEAERYAIAVEKMKRDVRESAATREGIAAFIAKRKPVFPN